MDRDTKQECRKHIISYEKSVSHGGGEISENATTK